MAYEYTTGTLPNENVVKADGVGPLPADNRALPFNANISTLLHELWLVSDNPLIYPGMFTIGGTWAEGDEAICAVRWGDVSIGFSHIAKAGEGARQVAEGLRNQMAADATFAQTPIFVMPVGEYGGGSSWHICPPWKCWNTEPKIVLTTGKTSVNGNVSIGRQPEDVLDTPACTVTIAHAVPGRPAKMNDLIGELRYMGQTDKIEGPDDKNIRQIFANLQVYIKRPSNSAPMGRWQFQNASGNENNVVNAMMLADGLVLCDANGAHPPGGSDGEGFMGAGTIHLPEGGSIWIGGKKVLG